MNQNIKNILEYIQERTMADSNTTWKDVKYRFGTDPTLIKDGYLYRPATYPRNESNNSSIKNFIDEEKKIEEEFIEILEYGKDLNSEEVWTDLEKIQWLRKSMKSRQISLIKMIVEMVESEKKENVNELYGNVNSEIDSFNQAIETIIRQLSNLRDELYPAITDGK
jgi:ribosomal protein S20